MSVADIGWKEDSLTRCVWCGNQDRLLRARQAGARGGSAARPTWIARSREVPRHLQNPINIAWSFFRQSA